MPDLFREARSSTQAINDRLTAVGLDGISAESALVLAAMILPGPTAEAVIAELEIPEETVSEMMEALALDGYLERQVIPEDDRVLIEATGPGRAVIVALGAAVQAGRWADFRFRPDDIVISSWPKSGTTWIQMICALLVFQVPEPPVSLRELSPWLDDLHVPRAQLYAQLDAQRHRRFIKSHLPLNELPIDSRVTRIVVARHPLDAAISYYNQELNIGPRQGGSDGSGHLPPQEPPPPAAREWLLQWLDSPELSDVLSLLSEAWLRRAEPNVLLMRYEDLCADLDGQMRRVAAHLGITVPGAVWPGLVRAAEFERMRAVADQLVPLGTDLKTATAFFHKGTSGFGRELLTAAELARYHRQAAQLASPDLLAWLHRQDGPR